MKIMSLFTKPAGLFVAVLALSSLAPAQWRQLPETGSPNRHLPNRTVLSGMSGMGPQLKVSLVDADTNAENKRAVVRIEVWGVELVEPHANEQPNLSKSFVTYQLDDGEVVKTTGEEHTFENISPGYHHVYVQLAFLSGEPRGARLTLTVHVPK